MSRFLGLDWDQHQLHLLQGTALRGTVRFEHAAACPGVNPHNLAQAEALGKQLRQTLKEQGFAAAPVLACIPRERVVVKEVRFPAVAPAEEAALVRFQAAKELAEPDNVAIDYLPRENGNGNGERRAFVVALRKDVVAFYQTVCKAAGLKLLTVTPRAFGLAEAVRHASPAPAAGVPVAVVTLAGQWGEMAVVRDNQILLSRPITPTANLVGEIRRNLAVYSGQTHSAADQIQGLYLAGADDQPELRESLEQALSLPVHLLDPFAAQEKVKGTAGSRGGYTAVAGLLHVWAKQQSAPVNLIKPREPRAVTDPGRRQKLLVGTLVFAVVVGLFMLGYWVNTVQAERVAAVAAEAEAAKKAFAALGNDAKQIEALKNWNKRSVVWIDELYDLTAKFPVKADCRIKSISGSLIEAKAASGAAAAAQAAKAKSGPDKAHAQFVLLGQVALGDDKLVDYLKDQLNKDGHQALVSRLPNAENKSYKEFQIKVELTKKPTDPYPINFVPPPAPQPKKIIVKVPYEKKGEAGKDKKDAKDAAKDGKDAKKDDKTDPKAGDGKKDEKKDDKAEPKLKDGKTDEKTEPKGKDDKKADAGKQDEDILAPAEFEPDQETDGTLDRPADEKIVSPALPVGLPRKEVTP